jgi:hypothetical protein
VVKRVRIEDRWKGPQDEDSIDAFYDEYRARLQIDKHAMDDMWLEQPAIVQEIGERVALETSRRDEAKDELADITAVADGEVRELHADDDKKPTETAIKNEVKQDLRVVKAQKRLRQLELNVARLQTLSTSFHQRRYALQDLTTLWTAGYFTSNSGAAKQARDRIGQTGREAMQAERKRREERD